MNLLSETDSSIVAVASDCELSGLDILVFDLNDITSIADHIWNHLHA